MRDSGECQPNLLFSVVSDLDECKKLWEEFSPEELLFDVWEYRACFVDPRFFTPHFIVASKDGCPIALLPLWFDRGCGYYEFFGGEFIERNRMFVKPGVAPDEALVSGLLAQAPSEITLRYIEPGGLPCVALEADESRFFVDLTNHGRSVETYLSSFSSKHRKNLRRDLQALEEKGYRIEINNLDHLPRLTELNIGRFGDGSFFCDPGFGDGFARLIAKAKERGELQMISVLIGGTVESVEAAVLFKGAYHVLLGGSNLEIDNIGKLMILQHIRNAAALGADIVDFLATDCNWKRLWNLSEAPLWSYHRGALDPLHSRPPQNGGGPLGSRDGRPAQGVNTPSSSVSL